jgi:NitT/TauT family transport system substrate-binding protein
VGGNLLEGLRQGQVDAGLIQEPALTLLVRSGARVLVNFMDMADAQRYLGGPYEFMGVAVRAKEVEARRAEMTALAKGLADGLKAQRTMSGQQMIAALRPELVAGLDTQEFGDILVRYRSSLYPETVTIDLESSRRVANSLMVGGLIKPDANVDGLYDTTIVGG